MNLPSPVVDQNKIVSGAIHFRETQHAFRLAYVRLQSQRRARGMTAAQAVAP
jgi:hypothetical protein